MEQHKQKVVCAESNADEFRRILEGEDDGANCHPKFQRDKKKFELQNEARGRMKSAFSDVSNQKVKSTTDFVFSATLQTVYEHANPEPSTESPDTVTVTRPVVPHKLPSSAKSCSLVSTSSVTDGESSCEECAPKVGSHEVEKFRASFQREEHDEDLDLSLTSLLFDTSEPMDGVSLPRINSLPSPTALAVATAQADFGSTHAHSQHGVDFAGLGHQQDLAWTQHYSLGALGSLPLITDNSPHSSGRVGDSEQSRSASSGSDSSSGVEGNA